MEWTVAIGVDTHKHEHVAVALDRVGRELDSRRVRASLAGYGELVAWAQQLGEPAFAIEGSGHWGAGLARVLQAHALPAYECERPRRDRGRAKNDLIDARLAARRLVAGERLASPRGSGAREHLRVLLLERRGAWRARTAALNQLQATLVTAPPVLRERLSADRGDKLARACLRLRLRGDDELDPYVAVLRRLARRAQALADELAEIDRELHKRSRALAPTLSRQCGVGPVCAAQLLVSSGDPGRMRTEGSFAALAGTSPVDASSGMQRRHRLNRGGDRQLNWALYMIARNRIRFDRETAAYYDRLLAHGKTKREAVRCVKRALARRFYRLLLTEAAPHAT